MNISYNLSIFDIILMIIVTLIFLIYILNYINLKKLRKNYSEFMKKLGNGNNIDEIIKEYMQEVDKIKKDNIELKNYCAKIEKDNYSNLKKIGMVRYNAYKNTGSNLSFALAILNDNNSGIILNGIYGIDTSNVYAKRVVNGTSEYILSKEEEDALDKAKINKNN